MITNENSEVAFAQHRHRLSDITEALKKIETPVACNGFAILMKDAMIIQLEGEEIRMHLEEENRKNQIQQERTRKEQAKKATWNPSKSIAVLGTVLITNMSIVLSVMKVVAAFTE
jgi:hypothetical protein